MITAKEAREMLNKAIHTENDYIDSDEFKENIKFIEKSIKKHIKLRSDTVRVYVDTNEVNTNIIAHYLINLGYECNVTRRYVRNKSNQEYSIIIKW